MLNIFKKIFGIAKKAILVFVVFTAILTLFSYFINKDKIKFTVNPQTQLRKEIYKTINDKKLQSSQEGKMFIATYRLINCSFSGEACTDNPEDGDKNFDKSIFGFVSGLVAFPYSNPPASGVYWASSTLEKAGFIPKTYAAEGIGFAALEPFRKIWSAFRNFTFILLVLVIVVIGFMIMFRMKINAQTVISVENALPRIVIALILITFSYPIAGFMIDLMYVCFLLVISILSSVGIDQYTPANAFNLLNQYASAGPGKLFPMDYSWLGTGNYLLSILPFSIGQVIKWVLGFLAAVGLAKLTWDLPKTDKIIESLSNIGVEAFTVGFNLGKLPGLAGIAVFWYLVIFFSVIGLPFIIGLLIALTILFMWFRLFFILLTTYIQILLLILFSPVILLFEAIPGRNAFSWWIKNVFANLLTFPFVLLIILVADLIIKINFQAGIDKFWSPPFLYPLNQTAIAFLFGLGLYLTLPDLIKMMKEMLGVKPLPISIGLGTFFAGAGTAVGGGLGLLGQYGSLSMAFPGLKTIVAKRIPMLGGLLGETKKGEITPPPGAQPPAQPIAKVPGTDRV